MNGNKRNTASSLGSDLAKVDAYKNKPADYDELPEITDEDIARARFKIGDVEVERPHPSSGSVRQAQVPVELDEDLVDRFRATGPGWQTRLNAALRRLVGAD